MQSDFVAFTWPSGSEWSVASEEALSQFIGRLSGLVVKAGGQPVTALPSGYELLGHARSGGNKAHIDRYLYGHPKGSRFRSVNEFVPHVLFLQSDRSKPCGCKYCSSSLSNATATPKATHPKREKSAQTEVKPKQQKEHKDLRRQTWNSANPLVFEDLPLVAVSPKLSKQNSKAASPESNEDQPPRQVTPPYPILGPKKLPVDSFKTVSVGGLAFKKASPKQQKQQSGHQHQQSSARQEQPPQHPQIPQQPALQQPHHQLANPLSRKSVPAPTYPPPKD
ncbi:UNVERIFIED_CONTAM: hypothetical protein HDU68_004604, partial [Siphonaria sp. JEL0065]